MITQDMVNEALDNAIENGYNMKKMAPIRVAIDLCTYDSRFEGLDPDSLEFTQVVRMVQTWQRSQTKL